MEKEELVDLATKILREEVLYERNPCLEDAWMNFYDSLPHGIRGEIPKEAISILKRRYNLCSRLNHAA